MNKLNITTKNNSSTELATKEILETLLGKWDISQYFFTDNVMIEDRAMPHSHPALTINSFPYNDQIMHLTDLLHEQLHWYFEEEQSLVDEAVVELKVHYPEVPVGHPLGCRDETSTYEHLLLCRLCHKITSNIFGEDESRQILYYLQNHHYLWVYDTIDKDSDYIDSLLDKYSLNIIKD